MYQLGTIKSKIIFIQEIIIINSIKNIGNNYRGYQGNNYKSFKPHNYEVKEPPAIFNKNSAQKEPLKYWECDGTHYFKDLLVRNKYFNAHSIHQVVTIGDMARKMPRICVALENRQAYH